MLTELSNLQESDEAVWGASEVSFTIETRATESNELVEREYTFSHASEWDKWTFTEFTEKRAEETASVSDRNWRRSRHIMWSASEAPTVDVPPEVTEQLEELLDIDKLVLQTP